VLGMFSTHYRRPRRPIERELKLLGLLARQAAGLTARSVLAAHLSCRVAFVGFLEWDIARGKSIDDPPLFETSPIVLIIFIDRYVR
jgi:hypothetical protein